MNIILDKKEVTDLRIWFNEYVNSFKFDDPGLQQNINLKAGHTKRVCIQILKLGKQLDLNEEELNLAETVALLHDIGRFEQYSQYRTFSDSKSVDHAELGLEILHQKGVLDYLDNNTKELIYCAIKDHNKPFLSDKNKDQCRFFIKILRDADKLDILSMVTRYYYRKDGKKNETLTLSLPDTPGYSEEVYYELLKKSIVNLHNVRNLNDLKLLQLGWIFDINFKPSMDYIRKQRYLEKIRDVLPDSKEISEIFDQIIRYRDEFGNC